ncbi:MAG: HEAT repeat domain-containing protein [Archangium sp.]|nr:HEAT repeat domain-containing protein [Archangium sp.]MDP3573405.1 HEAT repeat domain-containing protein [Archangium sp.]
MKLKSRIRSWQFVALGLSQAWTPLALAQSSSQAVPPVITSVTAPAPASLSWQTKLGVERAWRLQYQGTAQVDYSRVASAMTRSLGTARVASSRDLSRIQSLRYDIDAVLHTRVISVDASGWTVAARLHDVKYLVDGEADPRQDLFQAPFMVRFDATGRMGALSFMDKYPHELERAISRLIEPLQVALAAPGAARWVTQEQGVDTGFTATYEVKAVDGGLAQLIKNKTRITRSSLDSAELSLTGEARIARSETKIAFNLARHSVERLTSNEETSLMVGGSLFTADAHTFSAVEAPLPSNKLPTTLAGAKATLADPAFARARFYDVDLHTRPLVEGLDAATALSTYRTQVAGNLGLGVRFLEAWLRLNPSQSLATARSIDALDPKTDERAFGFGWAALASAGHREAQTALLQAAAGSGFKPESQEQALIAMMSLERPEPALAAGIWELRRTLASQQVGAPGAKLSIATNVYGSLGDVSKANPTLTTEVVRNLSALLASADVRQQVLALDGLSNVGDDARVLALAAPALSSRDEAVRVAAFGTFRRMGPATLPAFTTAFTNERSFEVRRGAVRTAGQLPDSEALASWARAAVITEQDPIVKGELVHLLGKGIAQHAANADTLRELLKTTTERRVRRDIYTYIAPAAGVR